MAKEKTARWDDGVGYFDDLENVHIPNFLNFINKGDSPEEVVKDLDREYGLYWREDAKKLIYENWDNYTWKSYTQSEMKELLEKVLQIQSPSSNAIRPKA